MDVRISHKNKCLLRNQLYKQNKKYIVMMTFGSFGV